MVTFRDNYVPDALPAPVRGINGSDELTEGYFGASLGFVADVIAHVMTLASHRIHALLDEASPDDSLPFHGEERRLPQYPAETPDQYRLRLWRAWEDYITAGSQQALLGQLDAAGYPGAEIVVNADWDSPWPHDPDNWSRFWVVIPSSVGFTSSPIPPADEQTITNIIKKWKPPHWVCVSVSVMLSTPARLVGWTDGAEVTFADIEALGYTFGDTDDVYKFEVI